MTPRTGRPRLGPENVRTLISVRVLPATISWLTAEAERRGVGLGQVLDQLVPRDALPAEAPPTGATKPGKKTAAATFLPGELEPVTTDAVTKKRKK